MRRRRPSERRACAEQLEDALKIAVLDDYQRVARSFGNWERLPATCTVAMFHDHVADETALAERLNPFEIVCVMRERTPITRSLLDRLPNLRLIVTTGMRNASLDVAAAHERGVVVCGTRSSGTATAELAMALLLALSRNLIQNVESVRAGGWQTGMGQSLSQSTVGILGLGQLGSRLAELVRPFGTRILAWSQNLTPDRAEAAGARLVGKDELFAESDFLSLHVVLSERTRGLVGARELALMKPTAAIINTSRGPIVDEAALIGALQRGRPAYAALDVFDQEPLPADSPLRDMKNVIATPHIGYVTDEAYEVYFRETVEDVLAFLEGKPVRVLGAGV
jgi:phosphoglycerate dehydrogenase-like enzyme